jgi:hypothetical protein
MDGGGVEIHTIRTALTLSTASRLLSTQSPVSADFVSILPRAEHWAPADFTPLGGEDSHWLSVPTDLGEDISSRLMPVAEGVSRV